MSRLIGRVRPVLLAGAAVLMLGFLLAACGGDDSSSTSTSSAATTTSEASSSDGAGKLPSLGSSPDFDPQRIYADASPSVVTILSVVGDPSDPTSQAGQGSGFVVSENGEIVTNAHVVTDATEAGGDQPISEADEVYVEFGDRNQVPAEIVGTDLNADVALLKVDPDGLDLKPIGLGDSDSIQVGAPVAAIGSPFGQEQSLSVGIVSATDRSIDSLTQFKIDGAIQTDTSINPGNSGGPLIGADGRVIGIDQQINTTSGGNEGVGFAVPINLVKRSVDQLRENGKVEYAYIGVKSQPLYPQLAEKLGIDAPTGSLISSVVPGGPAEKAGLQGKSDGSDSSVEFQGRKVATGGDVIVAVDGQKLVAENDLSRMIALKSPGDQVTLEIIRDGETMDVDVTLGSRPNPDLISGLEAKSLTALTELVADLAADLREVVLPELGRMEGREHSGDGAGGDVTFAIDERAEARMEEFLAERAPDVAFYSEDRGMVTPAGDPRWVLVVDPIDGTRPAMAGFESACVSVAAASLEGEPTMADVEVGCVVEIKSGERFLAVRGEGVEPAPRLSSQTSIERMLWTYGFRGRPIVPTAIVIEELIDSSSVSGGTFDLGSATYDMTRLVTGQLDAYVEPGPRMIDEVDWVRAEFERVGRGAILNNSPYDLAAAALILEEGGAIVTDAYGGDLSGCRLLGSGHEFQMSCVCAANAELHRAIVDSLDRGIERLRESG